MVVQSYPKVRRSVLWVSCLAAALSCASARDLSLRGFSPNAQDGFAVIFSPSPEPISALQFDLDYDNTSIKLYPAPGAATRNSNKILMTADLSATRKRIIVYGLNTDGITGGSLADIAVSWRAPAGTLKFKILNALAVFGNGAAAPIDVQSTNLSLLAESSQPLTPLGVWNAASVQASPVSGGAIMTLRGDGIGPDTGLVPENGVVASSLGGYNVTFDSLPAPLLYAGSDQINVIAPWAITDRAATQITIMHDASFVAGASVPVVEATPEIFTLTTAGTGGGAIVNQDGSVNTPLTPAPTGTVISIYGTGLGPLNPAGTDGAIAGVAYAASGVSVTIGDLPAEVLYAGSAPSLISGVFQINCRIPSDVLPGLAVPIRVAVGSARSASAITIAVR